jgi:hypothetical protein
LLATLTDIDRAIAELRPDVVAILKPESRGKRTYGEWAPRVALETLIRISAVKAEIPVEVLARPTVRSRLGIPQSKELSSHVSSVVAAAGHYWGAGRDVAALAALAADQEDSR